MDPWAKAIEEYSKRLNQNERELFRNSTADDILAQVQHAERVHAKSSKTRKLVQKIQPLLAAIEQYGKALDVISSSSSSVLCPLWGSLRILLQAAQQFSDYFVKVLDMLEHISDVLPRYGTYSVLFGKHVPLQNALSSTYLQIITFCINARRIFARKISTFSKMLWKPFDEEFGGTLDKFRRYRQLVEDEARLAHMIESMEEREESSKERARMAKERKLAEESRNVINDIKAAVDIQEESGNMIAIKKWVNGRLCTVELEDLQEECLAGTCEWILQREELSKWLNDEQIRILWVHGMPGCGKSFAYSRLLSHLSEQSLKSFHFLFCASDHERETTSSLIHSWLLQVVEKFPHTTSLFNSFMRGNEYRSATKNEATELFLSLLDAIPPCYFTADGLDECMDRMHFFRLLPHIIKRHKILLFSREALDIRNSLLQRSAQLEQIIIRPEHTKMDIDLYISHRLATEFEDFEDALVNEIRHKLADCQGMFLWVKLMFDHLLMQTTWEELLDSLNHLPVGLDATYDSILRRINEMPKARRLLAYRILLWVTTARRPLTVAEMRTLLAIRPGNQSLDEKRLVIGAKGTIPEICAPLLELRRGKIHVTHFTVSQYLARYLDENEILHEVTADYEFGPFKSANHLAAAVCLTYLSFPEVGEVPQPDDHLQATQIVSTDSQILSLLSYASLHWFEHFRLAPPADTLLERLVRVFMDPNTTNMERWWRLYWFLGDDSEESVVCPSRFSPIHVAAYLGLAPLIPTLMAGTSNTMFDSRGRTPLWWACSMGHASTSTALLEAGFDPNTPDHHSITPVHRAAAAGHSETFKNIMTYLKCHSGRVGKAVVDPEGWTPLHWAASRGHTNIIRQIISGELKDYGDEYSRCRSGRTPLHLAALNGHATACQVLCCTSSINLQDNQGSTALHLAAMRGHIRTIKVLAEMLPDTSIRDADGKTAAEKASIMGQDDTATLIHRIEHHASFMRSSDIIPSHEEVQRAGKALVEHGIELLTGMPMETTFKPNSRDSHDSSFLESCVNGHLQTLELLALKCRKWKIMDSHGRSTLHHAAVGGHKACVIRILRLCRSRRSESMSPKAFIDHQDDKGWTALHYAAAGNFAGVVKILLEEGASPQIKNHKGDTAYTIAAREGYQATLECMIKFPSFSTEVIATGLYWSPLHCYARDGDLAGVQQAIRDSEDLRISDRFGRTPIHRALDTGKGDVVRMLADAMSLSAEELMHLAVYSADEKMVEILLPFLPQTQPLRTRGLEANAWSLLLWAVKHDNESIVREICRTKSDANVYDFESRETILHSAIRRNHDSIAELLIERGADVSLLDDSGMAPLHCACQHNLLKVVRCLLNHGADVNQRVKSCDLNDGSTPLHFAIQAYSGYEQTETISSIIQCLLEHGADVNLENRDVRSPLWLAHDKSRPGLAELFRKYRPELTIQPISDEGLMPLHIAASAGDLQRVKSILDTGVPVNWPTVGYSGPITPLEFAIKNRHVDVVKLLLDYGADIFYSGLGPFGFQGDYFITMARALGYKEIEKLLVDHLLERCQLPLRGQAGHASHI